MLFAGRRSKIYLALILFKDDNKNLPKSAGSRQVFGGLQSAYGYDNRSAAVGRNNYLLRLP